MKTTKKMNFNELDALMRQYEWSLDQTIPPDVYIIARLDGRSFTKLTKETCDFEAPFDVRFRDLMVDTTKYLMQKSGFQIIYGYTQSDEISLLFALNENTFGRKVRKINTTLAGEASAYFTRELSRREGIDGVATFDCRVCPMPNINKVLDYFTWRQEDATRNSLNAFCYWTLRKEGKTQRQAGRELERQTIAYKNDLLFQYGINFNDVDSWKKRGVGLYFTELEKEGYNPSLCVKVTTMRRVIDVDYELDMKEEYRKYVLRLIKENE